MLLVDNKWLLIGPNRHGSLYSKAVLQAEFRTKPSSGDRPQHTPLCKIPQNSSRGKIIVGIIRCPLRWYLSKWWVFEHFCLQFRPEKRQTFQEYFFKHWQNPQGPIGNNMDDMPKRVDIGAWSYKHVAYHCLDAVPALESMNRHELADHYHPGLLSCQAMMCTETLRDDLPRIFGDRVRPHLDKPQNGTDTKDARRHYTDEQIELIREKDGWLVSLYPNLESHDLLCS